MRDPWIVMIVRYSMSLLNITYVINVDTPGLRSEWGDFLQSALGLHDECSKNGIRGPKSDVKW